MCRQTWLGKRRGEGEREREGQIDKEREREAELDSLVDTFMFVSLTVFEAAVITFLYLKRDGKEGERER